MRRLDLGAGLDRTLTGAVTVDRLASAQPDVVHDLDHFPWPFETGSFDQIRAMDVVEHLSDLLRTMDEMHRIARPGARVEIYTPHYSCRNSWTDPTHRFHLGYFSFDYFTVDAPFAYTTRLYRIVHRRLRARNTWKGRVVEQIANRWPAFYEEHLAWMLPALFLEVVLEVVKDT